MKATILKALAITRRIATSFFLIFGVFAFIMLVLSFTDLPYWAYHSLAMTDKHLEKDPQLIVVLGGNGLPSPDGFIRTYYASEAAKKFIDAKVLIAIPGDPGEEEDQPRMMARELRSRGIDSTRVVFETEGHNTRSQAINIAAMYASRTTQPVLLITSPEHVYRSVRTFEEAGFTDVAGSAAFEMPLDEDRVSSKGEGKEKQVNSLDLRYNMWSYLQYEIVVLREYTAIAYYKLKGWI